MQAVLLAAGRSSRFVPFTDVSHKSMVGLCGKPILAHTISSLKKVGITDIIIVVNEESDIPEVIGKGKEFGVTISYVTHVGAKGMGAALLDAKEKINGPFFLLNAYHADVDLFAKDMISLQKTSQDSVLLGRKEIPKNEFGYFQTDGEKVIGVEEKPRQTSENAQRIVGIYLLSQDFLKTLEETPLEHYHFEKALDTFSKKQAVYFLSTEKETLSLKYSWDLLRIKDYLLGAMQSFISPSAKIAKGVILPEKIYIEDRAEIMEGAVLKGACYIGKNSVVGSCAILRNGVCLEEGAVAGARIELKNDILMKQSTTHSGFLGDSIVGEKTKIAAFVCTANARLDRKNVATIVKDEKIDTGLRHLGAVIGNNANIGIRVSFMPGTLIGSSSIIGPSTTVMKNIGSNTKYYTKFQEVIEHHE